MPDSDNKKYLIALYQEAVESLFRQGNLAHVLELVSNALPEKATFHDLYAICDEHYEHHNEDTEASSLALMGKLKEKLGGNDDAAFLTLQLYEINECIRGYAESVYQQKNEQKSHFETLRDQKEALEDLTNALVELSGIGRHQAEQCVSRVRGSIQEIFRDSTYQTMLI